jgi:formate dehydrogenase gamma subunit
MATSADRFIHRPNAIDRLGKTVVYTGELLRHPVYTRFLHWMVGIFFFLALLSGFGIYLPWIFRFFTPLFGGGAMTRLLHPWFGLGFVFFFALQAINWLQVMKWTPGDSRWLKHIRGYVIRSDSTESPETAFFNGGQKLMFWEIVCGSIAYLITGFMMWFPEIFRANRSCHLLCDSRHIRADHAVWYFLSHLSQHLRRARDHSSYDAGDGQRGLGLDASSCLVQSRDGTRSPAGNAKSRERNGSR